MKNTAISIDEYIKTKGDVVEKYLQQLLNINSTPYQRLIEAAQYSLLGAGKRLRPILAIATAEALGCRDEKVLPAACALEMVHTYSLIHDDLPCMDDDDLRRGKPTLHKAFDEAHAVLAGDYLLTYAFEVLSSAPLLSAPVKVDLISTLARRAGADGMIGGQVMDIESESKSLSQEALREVHLRKTGAMICSSVEFGAIAAEAGKETLEKLRTFGNHIGLAFQIIDDVLDVTSTEQSLGKTIGSDIANDKTTYVSLLGVTKAKEAAMAHYEYAIASLDALPVDFSRLKELAAMVVERES